MLRILLPDTDNKCFAISSCERKRVTETAQGGGVSDKDLIIAQHKTVLTYTYIHKYTQKIKAETQTHIHTHTPARWSE